MSGLFNKLFGTKEPAEQNTEKKEKASSLTSLTNKKTSGYGGTTFQSQPQQQSTESKTQQAPTIKRTVY